MNPSRIAKIRQLFEEASALPADRIPDYLTENCKDAQMREEVEALLAESSEAEGAFEKIADDAIRAPLSAIRKETSESPLSEHSSEEQIDPEKPGQQIGPYQLVRLIGEGGFGSVWEARQEEPVKRRVAIKFLKVGMATKEIIRRFEAERQALAIMGHPSIAQVYDAGATDSGRSYFVMEYVEGIPLIQFCEKHKLSLKKRLKLFCMLCDAIQHAHQRGIVHRDLKPNNILVHYEDGSPDSAPIVKIIDFGVAKVLGSTAEERTMITGLGQIIGTPAYMSPEQASFGMVLPDTRTDVYSLGVLLYELLTGTLPFGDDEFKKASILAIQRIIQKKDPPRPSTRLSELKAIKTVELKDNLNSLQVDYRQYYRSLHIDLDWVVMKCLEKDKERRYASANELHQDIERFLNHEPLVAGPPTRAYRIGKFVRRYRRTVLATSFVVMAFLLGFAGTIIGLIQARQAKAAESEQRQVAEARTKELELVTDFQQSVFERLLPEQIGAEIFRSMLESYDELLEIENIPTDERESKVSSLRQSLYQLNPTDLARHTFNDFVLKKSSQAITEQFADQPQIEAALRESLAKSFRQIGLIQEAIDEQERIIQLRSGMGDLIITEAKLELATTYLEGRFYSKANAILEPLLKETKEKGLKELLPRVRFKLGQAQYARQDYEVAEATLKQAHKEFVEILGSTHPATLEAELEAIHAMRHFEYTVGYNALQITTALAREAIPQEPLLRQTLNKILSELDENDPLVWRARFYWAISVFLHSWIPEEILDNRTSYENGLVGRDQLNLIYKSQKQVLGANHPTTLKTLKTLTYLKIRTDIFYTSDPLNNRRNLNTLKAILSEELEIWGDNHRSVVESLVTIAYIQYWFGFHEESYANVRRAIDVLNKIYRVPNEEVADLYKTLTERMLSSSGDGNLAALAEAEKCLETARAANVNEQKMGNYQRNYISALIGANRLEEAEKLAIELKSDFQRWAVHTRQGKTIETDINESQKTEEISNYQRGFWNSNTAHGISDYFMEKGEFDEAKKWLIESYACHQLTIDGDPRKFAILEYMPIKLFRMGFREDALEWANKWEANKENFIRVYPSPKSSPAFPYCEPNPYFSKEAYLLKSVAIWEELGETEKADSFIREYFEFKDWINSEGDPELREGYIKACKSKYGIYTDSDAFTIRIAPIFAQRGYFEEAEWFMLRGKRIIPYYRDSERVRDWCQLRIDFYKAWHEADPEGGHLEEIPKWQEKIDAIDAEYAKWRTKDAG